MQLTAYQRNRYLNELLESIAYYIVIIDVRLSVVNSPGIIKGGKMKKSILQIVISGAISIAAAIAKEAAKKAINAK
jgi:hypothetical protein